MKTFATKIVKRNTSYGAIPVVVGAPTTVGGPGTTNNINQPTQIVPLTGNLGGKSSQSHYALQAVEEIANGS
jgi:hypothetical protein